MTNLPSRFKVEAAQDNVAPHWVTVFNGFGEYKDYKLEALPIILTGLMVKGKVTASNIRLPFHFVEEHIDHSLEGYWNQPKGLIVREIKINTAPKYPRDPGIRFVLQIGEKNYHCFGHDGLTICDKGEEYDWGIYIGAPQYFSIRVNKETYPCEVDIHGIFLREIC